MDFILRETGIVRKIYSLPLLKVASFFKGTTLSAKSSTSVQVNR